MGARFPFLAIQFSPICFPEPTYCSLTKEAGVHTIMFMICAPTCSSQLWAGFQLVYKVCYPSNSIGKSLTKVRGDSNTHISFYSIIATTLEPETASLRSTTRCLVLIYHSIMYIPGAQSQCCLMRNDPYFSSIMGEYSVDTCHVSMRQI